MKKYPIRIWVLFSLWNTSLSESFGFKFERVNIIHPPSHFSARICIPLLLMCPSLLCHNSPSESPTTIASSRHNFACITYSVFCFWVGATIRLPSEKLDRNNFASWEYKMHQYLVGQGYWSYIKGALLLRSVTRRGSRDGTAGVLDRKDSKLAQALARLRLNTQLQIEKDWSHEREIDWTFIFRFKKQVTRSIR